MVYVKDLSRSDPKQADWESIAICAGLGFKGYNDSAQMAILLSQAVYELKQEIDDLKKQISSPTPGFKSEELE